MRLWSLHPSYLDVRGLVALWREGLLAQNVLLGKTKGYKNHPQLNRFKAVDNPQAAIACYLSAVVDEADKRQYNFKRDKIIAVPEHGGLYVTRGQLEYEWTHLLKKLKQRDYERFTQLSTLKQKLAHPMFAVVTGEIEAWEVLPNGGSLTAASEA